MTSSSPITSPARVWLVDDSPLQAEVGRRALVDHAVDVFHDASLMFERLAAEEPPDLLVLDWQMPGTSGREACEHVRARFDQAQLPIIILTASDRREDLAEGLDVGANDFVRKPFNAPELLARVATLIQTKRLHDKLARTEAVLRDEAAFREQFLAILAHDLRQPLNVFALGNTLLPSPSDDPILGVVRIKMERASSRMQRMIKELLDFSRARPEHGMPIVPRMTDLGVVAGEVVEEIRIAHPLRTIDLTFVGPCEGNWDPDRLAQVVSNLIENALANSPTDTPVRFALSRRAGRIELAVENQGPTIAPDVMPTLFTAFREPSFQRNRSGGLGLGLYIVAQIVRAHGGTIHAESAAGRTRFEVRLPTSARVA